MVAGKKDKCVKGISCGLTCINQSKDCISEFPLELQPIVQKLAERLVEQYELAGDKVDLERVKMLDSLKEVDSNFRKLLEGKSEEQQVFFVEMRVLATGKQRDKSEKFVYSDTEALGLNARSEELISSWNKTKERGFTPEGIREPGGVADYVRKHRTENISDEDVELFWSSLPDTMKKNLSNMGDAKGKYWKGKSLEDQEVVPSEHGNATEMRGKMLLKIYLQQGGRDLYTGQRLPLAEADLEHIVPLKKGGVNSEDPMNWGFIRTGINAGRADKDLDFYVEESLRKNLGIKPGQSPQEEAVKALRGKWVKNEEDNILRREQKKLAEGTDWEAADEESFNAALAQFRSKKKDYNMVLAIAGKENVSTTLELPGTAAQIQNNRRGRDYWMTVGAYRSDSLPQGESLASWSAKAWKNASPSDRRKIEYFWRQAQLEAQKAWQESNVMKDPETAKAKAKEIAAEVIRKRTEELMSDLGL